MKIPTNLGLNMTGIDSSPIDSKALIQGTENTKPSSNGTVAQIALERTHYIQQADPVGSVPIPASIKGIANTGLQKLKGHKPEVLIDKLGERLAFERTGVRLYEALITKYEASKSVLSIKDQNRAVGAPFAEDPLPILRQFHTEELRHFELLRDAIHHLGADPTAQTPCADATGVASMGLLQVVADPRTSFTQCLQAVLIAELTDNDGWEMLTRLTREIGLENLATSFQVALTEESQHLAVVRTWLEHLTLSDARVTPKKAA